jgi:hypothetical protein
MEMVKVRFNLLTPESELTTFGPVVTASRLSPSFKMV